MTLFGIARIEASSDLNDANSSLVGLFPTKSRYATSSNVAFAARSAISYPRYMSCVWLTAQTAVSPMTWPAKPLWSACFGAFSSVCDIVSF